jgi:hypothetical protein
MYFCMDVPSYKKVSGHAAYHWGASLPTTGAGATDYDVHVGTMPARP